MRQWGAFSSQASFPRRRSVLYAAKIPWRDGGRRALDFPVGDASWVGRWRVIGAPAFCLILDIGLRRFFAFSSSSSAILGRFRTLLLSDDALHACNLS